jgi:hypothetical protein
VDVYLTDGPSAQQMRGRALIMLAEEGIRQGLVPEVQTASDPQPVQAETLKTAA